MCLPRKHPSEQYLIQRSIHFLTAWYPKIRGKRFYSNTLRKPEEIKEESLYKK